MMKKWIRKNKLNNGGFSLIEVLVAIVVLAIVSTTLIQGFLSVSKNNARGRKLQDATDLAQSVAEYYGAQSLTSLISQGISTKVVPTDTNLNPIYVFEYEDTEYMEDFHVIAVLNPNKTEEFQNVNAEDTPVLNHMYSNSSTYWMREFGRYDDDALNYIRTQSGNQGVKQEDIVRKSVVDIQVTSNAADANGQSKITISYTLKVDYSATVNGTAYHKQFSPGYRMTSFSSAQQTAPALYLVYSPYDTKNISCSDELVINCTCDASVNWLKGTLPVYLISQEDNRKFSGANVTLKDMSVTQVMEIHTNMQDIANGVSGCYSMTTGGSLDIIGEASKNMIYQLDVYVLSKDEYDTNGNNWVASDDKSGVTVKKYFTNFTTSTVK